MTIYIDCREKQLIEELHNVDLKFTCKSLDNGDVHIIANQIICLERKTIQDFYASIRDNRFQEQKNRIKKCQADLIIYLIEGNNISHGKGNFNDDFLDKTLWTLLLSEHIKIIKTDNIHQTALFIKHILNCAYVIS